MKRVHCAAAPERRRPVHRRTRSRRAAELVGVGLGVGATVLASIGCSRSAPDATPEVLESAARADPRVAELLDGTAVRRVIAVPGRLVNFVV